MSWRGMDGATAAAQLGHDYVATPTTHCYLDYPSSVISLEKAYSFEPIPEKLTAAQSALPWRAGKPVGGAHAGASRRRSPDLAPLVRLG